MGKVNYFLCSKSVVDRMNPTEVSKPFKSGYDWEKDEKYFIAKLNFKEAKKLYGKMTEDEQDVFWCRELVGGTMDVSKITLSGAKKNGLFVEIEQKIGLTAGRNIAMTVHELSEKFNCNPIEFINKIA
jgi:hypothetical protein